MIVSKYLKYFLPPYSQACLLNERTEMRHPFVKWSNMKSNATLCNAFFSSCSLAGLQVGLGRLPHNISICNTNDTSATPSPPPHLFHFLRSMSCSQKNHKLQKPQYLQNVATTTHHTQWSWISDARLPMRESKHYIAWCAPQLAYSYLSGHTFLIKDDKIYICCACCQNLMSFFIVFHSKV